MIIDLIFFIFKWVVLICKKIVWLIVFIFKLFINLLGSIYNGFVYLIFPSKKRQDIKKFKWIKLLKQSN